MANTRVFGELPDIYGQDAKTTPVAADVLLLEDSADSYNKKKITYSSLAAAFGDVYQQSLVVAKSGGDYTTIQGAIDAITDATTSKRYTIRIMPGTYTENVVMEEYVSLVGFDFATTVITSASGITVTAPPSTSEASLINLTITSTPTADSAEVLKVTTGTVHVNHCVLEMTSSTNGVEGNLINLDGGMLMIHHANLVYTLTGSSAGAATHNVVDVAGTVTFHLMDSHVDIDVSDVDDTVVFINEATGATITEDLIKNNIIHLDLNSGSYSGSAGVFYLHGAGTDKHIENCHVHIASAGNGTGYIFYMDTTGGAGVINAIANKGICEGFTTNYAGNVASGDTLNGSFVRLTAADGFTGAGTANVVSSAADGSLTVTGTITGDLTGDVTGTANGNLEDLVDDTSPQLGGNLDLNSNEITIKAVDFIPVGYMIDGSSPPAAKATLSSTNKVDTRAFDGASNEDLQFMWQAPFDLTGATITFRVVGFVSNATAPANNEIVAFSLAAMSASNSEIMSTGVGTAATSSLTADATYAQYDRLATTFSGTITPAGTFAAGESVFCTLIRLAATTDTYAQDFDVAGIEIKYSRALTND